MHGSILFRFLRIHFFSHFESFLKLLKKGRNGQKGVILVWHVVVWTLWRTRNERISLDKVVAVVEIVDRIKNCCWKWILAKKTTLHVLTLLMECGTLPLYSKKGVR
jgi:hypothetical protein